jgi:isopropylmalate/homocitrate/citramalate synthase
MQGALAAKVQEIAVFGAASEAFTQKNINCTIEESLTRFQTVMDIANEHKIKVRGYVSCVMGSETAALRKGSKTPPLILFTRNLIFLLRI